MLNITPKRIKVLQMLFNKNIETGTVKDICKQMEGSNYDTETLRFLYELVKLSILEVTKDADYKTINGKQYVTYTVDKEQLKLFWLSRPEYKLSRDIIVDTYALADLVID